MVLRVRDSLRDAPGGVVGVLTSTAVLVPVVLVVALVMLLAAGLLLHDRAAAVGRASVGDTGPVLAGVELPADGGAGPPTVVLAPEASGHPESVAVRDLIQRSTDARNARDYAAWTTTMTADAVAGTSSAAFAAETRTQRVGSVTLRRIDPVGGGELVVPMGMVTTQDPADAPADVRVGRLCWQVGTVVTPDRGVLRIARVQPGSALRTPC